MWCTTRFYFGTIAVLVVYMNDLPDYLIVFKIQDLRLFADDTNLTASSHSIADVEIAINSHLENLRNWLMANKLSLNVAKTDFMLIGSPQMIRNALNSQPNILIKTNKSEKLINPEL